MAKKTALDQLLELFQGVPQAPGMVPPLEINIPLEAGSKPVSDQGRQLMQQMIQASPQQGFDAIPGPEELTPATGDRLMHVLNMKALNELLRRAGAGKKEAGIG